MECQECNTCGQAIASEASVVSEDRTPPCPTSLSASKGWSGTKGLEALSTLCGKIWGFGVTQTWLLIPRDAGDGGEVRKKEKEGREARKGCVIQQTNSVSN
jgi:hypothetical protein